MDEVARQELRALKQDRLDGIIDSIDYSRLKQAAVERGIKRLNALVYQGAPHPPDVRGAGRCALQTVLLGNALAARAFGPARAPRRGRWCCRQPDVRWRRWRRWRRCRQRPHRRRGGRRRR